MIKKPESQQIREMRDLERQQAREIRKARKVRKKRGVKISTRRKKVIACSNCIHLMKYSNKVTVCPVLSKIIHDKHYVCILHEMK